MKAHWRSSYQIDISDIDKQHQCLIEMSDRIVKMAMHIEDIEISDEIKNLLEELKEYAKFHFQFEENLLIEYGYDNVQEHIGIHQEFIQRIITFEKEFQEGSDKALLVSLLEFITSWIVKHIMLEDKKYATQFKSRGLDIFSK